MIFSMIFLALYGISFLSSAEVNNKSPSVLPIEPGNELPVILKDQMKEQTQTESDNPTNKGENDTIIQSKSGSTLAIPVDGSIPEQNVNVNEEKSNKVGEKNLNDLDDHAIKDETERIKIANDESKKMDLSKAALLERIKRDGAIVYALNIFKTFLKHSKPQKISQIIP